MCRLFKIHFFFILIFLSCNQHDNIETVSLTSISLELDIPYMRFPYRVNLGDSALVILDLASDSCFYHILRYPDFHYHYSLGKRGNGPAEIVLPTICQFEDNKLLIYDGAKGRLFKYTLFGDKDSLRVVDFNVKAVDFVYLNDTSLIIGDVIGGSRLNIISPHFQNILFGFSDELMPRQMDNVGGLWRSFMDINKDKNAIATATQFGDVIEIFELNKKTQKSIVGKGGTPRGKKQIDGFCDIKWSGDHIYALYSGRNRDELMRAYESGVRPPDGGNVIKKYNRQGELILIFNLDKYINGFAIDEQKNRIIGVTSNFDRPIVVYDVGLLKL